MKILILSPAESSPLACEVALLCVNRNHVFEISHLIDEVEREIARTVPHACVILAPVHFDEANEIVARYHQEFPTVYFRVLRIRQNGELEETWSDNLGPVFEHQPELPAHLTIAPQRQIHYATEFTSLFTGDKLNRPGLTPCWEQELADEQNKLLWLLEGAKKHHARAKEYHRLLCEVAAAELQEACYRTLHGSCKAWFYSREELARWLAVLSHSVPGIQLEYLPPPGDLGPAHKFIHFYTQHEVNYALVSATLYAHDDFRDGMASIVGWHLSGKTKPADLIWLNASIRGWVAYARQIAETHLRLMDRWLQDKPTADQITNPCRTLRRDIQLFCEYWQLPRLRNHAESLLAAIHDFHAGVRAVNPPRFPTFQVLSEEADREDPIPPIS